jgi:hypothetical protein
VLSFCPRWDAGELAIEPNVLKLSAMVQQEYSFMNILEMSTSQRREEVRLEAS